MKALVESQPVVPIPLDTREHCYQHSKNDLLAAVGIWAPAGGARRRELLLAIETSPSIDVAARMLFCWAHTHPKPQHGEDLAAMAVQDIASIRRIHMTAYGERISRLLFGFDPAQPEERHIPPEVIDYTQLAYLYLQHLTPEKFSAEYGPLLLWRHFVVRRNDNGNTTRPMGH